MRPPAFPAPARGGVPWRAARIIYRFPEPFDRAEVVALRTPDFLRRCRERATESNKTSCTRAPPRPEIRRPEAVPNPSTFDRNRPALFRCYQIPRPSLTRTAQAAPGCSWCKFRFRPSSCRVGYVTKQTKTKKGQEKKPSVVPYAICFSPHGPPCGRVRHHAGPDLNCAGPALGEAEHWADARASNATNSARSAPPPRPHRRKTFSIQPNHDYLTSRCSPG